MAASPPNRFARSDLRPAQGANVEVPGFAKGDHVLQKWVLEERQRRRTFLADQVLEPCEPLPQVRHPHPLFKPFVNAYESFNRATSYRLHPLMKNTAFIFGIFVIPIWGMHYVTKYHWQGTHKMIETKPVVYPKEDLAEHGHH